MLDNISLFGFRALWSPFFFIFVLSLAILYLSLVIGPFAKRFKGRENVKPMQVVYFLSALTLLYMIKGSPIDLLGHLNFSIHMTQMALLYLTIPPLLLFGTPKWILHEMLRNRLMTAIVKFFTKPLIALLLFNGMFSFYHFPFIFDSIKTDPFLHASVTILLFISAIFMWCPLITPITEFGKLSGLQKMGYIFADGVLLTPACALIIFAQEPLYATYTDPTVWAQALQLCVPIQQLNAIDLSQPQMFSFLPPKEDQQLGGVIMKILQEIMYGVILAYSFFQWVKEERENEKHETVNSIISTQPSE